LGKGGRRGKKKLTNDDKGKDNTQGKNCAKHGLSLSSMKAGGGALVIAKDPRVGRGSSDGLGE